MSPRCGHTPKALNTPEPLRSNVCSFSAPAAQEEKPLSTPHRDKGKKDLSPAQLCSKLQQCRQHQQGTETPQGLTAQPRTHGEGLSSTSHKAMNCLLWAFRILTVLQGPQWALSIAGTAHQKGCSECSHVPISPEPQYPTLPHWKKKEFFLFMGLLSASAAAPSERRHHTCSPACHWQPGWKMPVLEREHQRFPSADRTLFRSSHR